MRLSTIFFLFFLSVPLFSQSFGSNFESELTNCPYDSTIEVSQPIRWEVYQTFEDVWDGTRDSSLCLDFEAFGLNNVKLDLSQIDPNKSVFYRLLIEEEMPLLSPNTFYNTSYGANSEADLIILDSCQNELCSGFMIYYTVPNESGNSTETRIIKKSFYDSNNIIGESCWATDNLEDIQLQEVIMKFTFSPSLVDTQKLSSGGLYIDENNEAQPIHLFSFSQNLLEDTVYVGTIAQTVQLEDGNNYYYQPLFVQQSNEAYPSFDNLTYVEVFPDFTTIEQETFNLVYDYGESMIFEPFTGIQGSLVEGNNFLRHNLIIDFMLPELCQSLVIADIIVPNTTTYRFSSGELEFANGQSCFMFIDGGSLRVKPNETLYYGKNGIGVLALAREGHIYLNENSKLIIGNKLLLNAFSGGPSEHAYVHLAEGSHLSFSEHGSLIRNFGSHLFLNVYMNGGTINVSNLSDEEQALIRYIYPSFEPTQIELIKPDEILISPNPIISSTTMIKLSAGIWEETINYQLIDLNGRIVDRGKLTTLGNSFYEYNTAVNLPSGVYTFLVKQGQFQASGRLIVQRE